jgi:hypothetical protein
MRTMMTKREEYDALAAKLKAEWDYATSVEMTGAEWDVAAAQAKLGEEKLRAIFG